MATANDLDRCVVKAIKEERKRVKRMRQAHPKVKHRITDYAAVVVACGYTRSGTTFSGHSASPIGLDYTAGIKSRLNALAPIGEKRNGCENIVGACAEPHAANKVMSHFPGCKFEELQLSVAYRPRTARRIKNCQNCKDTFPEVL